jgi:hypothetical protein
MTKWLTRAVAGLVRAWGGAEELVGDMHIYGGGLIAAVSLAAIAGRPAVAPLTFGLLLAYIGLRR